MNIRGAVTVGQGYSTIAWIPEAQGSWALPLLHERISSGSSPILQAASQLKLVCEQSVNPVLAVLDREYGNATWVLAQADIQADCLMRVRKNACLWSAPPAYSGRGRPRKHGSKNETQRPNHMGFKWIQRLKLTNIQIWEKSESDNGLTYIFIAPPGQKVNLILVERMKPMSNGQPFPPLWLAWVGERTLPLETVWFKYLRRFGVRSLVSICEATITLDIA